jgi:hypothetical protein
MTKPQRVLRSNGNGAKRMPHSHSDESSTGIGEETVALATCSIQLKSEPNRFTHRLEEIAWRN